MMHSLPRRWADRLLQGLRSVDQRPALSPDDERLIAGLRAGDEAAFSELMDRYGPSMIKVALMYVPTLALAEEVVQETWLAVLRGIDDFQGRSSLRTWIFRILVKRARATARAEARSVSFSALTRRGQEPSVDPALFAARGHWASFPQRWDDGPEGRVLASELLDLIRAALETLPAAQRAVVMLRDIDGFAASEVCDLLDLTPANQRVLLHRGRGRIRAFIQGYVEDRGAARER